MADREPLLSASAIILLVIVGSVASGFPFVIINDGSLIAASAGIAVSKATEQVLQQGALVAAPLLFDLEFNGNRIHSVLRIMLLLSLIVSNVIKLVLVYCADFMYAPLLSLLGESLLPIGAGSAVLVYVSHFHKDKLTSFEVILAYMALIASRVLKGLQIVYPEWSLIYDIFLYSLFFGIALVVCLIATISFNTDSKQYCKFDSLYLYTPLLWMLLSLLVPLYVNGSLRHDLQSTTSHNLCNAMNVVFTLVLVIASRKFGTHDGSSEKTETTNELAEVETRQSQSTQEGSSHHHVPRRDSPVVQVSKRHTREQQTQIIPKEGIVVASGGGVSKARVWNSLSEAGATIKGPQANSCFVDRKKIDAEQPHNSRSNVLQVTDMFEPGKGTAHNAVALPSSFPLMEVPSKSDSSAAATATLATTVFPAVPLTPLEVRPAAPRLVSRPSPPSSSNSPFPPPSSSSSSGGGAVNKATPPSAAVSSSNPSSTIATSTGSAASLVLTPLRAPPEVLKASPARLSVSASLAAARDRAVTPTRRQHHIETAGETVVTPLSSPKEDYVRSLTVVSVMQNLVQKVVTASAPNRRSSKVAAEEAEAVRSQLNPKPSVAPPNLKKISPIVASSTANGSGYTPLLHSHDVLDVQDEVVLLEHQALVAEELKNKKDQIRQRRAAAAAAAATNNGQKK